LSEGCYGTVCNPHLSIGVVSLILSTDRHPQLLVYAPDGKSYFEMRRIEPIGILHEYPGIAVSWLKGTTLDWTDAKQEVEGIVERLETIAGGEGSNNES